jgi:DNA-binding response OmpR family regulator
MRRCIVADDEPGMRALLSRVLSKEHFLVQSVSGGRDAIALLNTQPYDLLVTDLVMPDGEGIETIRAVKLTFPGVKILAISGKSSSEILRMARLLGADATLPKPFTDDQFIAIVRGLFEAPPA